MMRPSRFRIPDLAWAGFDEDDLELFSHRFEHGRHRGGHHGKHSGEDLFDRGWGDEYRHRRGDIKYILLELLSDRPSHGYDLIKAMETRFGGFRRLSPGSVYPTLQMLEEGGYLTSEQSGGKRVYTITDEGRQLLAERGPQNLSDNPRDASKGFMKGKPEEFTELRKAATELAAAVVQVARSGNVENMSRVRKLLDQVKRDIYTILAGE